MAGRSAFLDHSSVLLSDLVHLVDGGIDLIKGGRLFLCRRRDLDDDAVDLGNLADDALDRAVDELADYDAAFDVWGFSLYEHGADHVWRPQRDYAFGRPLPGPVEVPAH